MSAQFSIAVQAAMREREREREREGERESKREKKGKRMGEKTRMVYLYTCAYVPAKAILMTHNGE